MQQIFKVLATINALALFILGWGTLIAGYSQLIEAHSGAIAPPGVPPIEMTLMGGVASLTLSVVLMKLRQMME